MRKLSGGNTIAHPSAIVRHEIRSGLISKLKLDVPLAPFEVLGRGLEHALGRSLNFRLEWPHAAKVPEHFQNKLELEVFELIEVALLSGVLDAGPESTLFPQMNLDSDKQFRDHLTTWRGSAARMSRDELRRTVYATTLLDIQKPLATVLAELGITMEQFALLDEAGCCELLDMMPSRRADMHLRTQWAKNANPKNRDRGIRQKSGTPCR